MMPNIITLLAQTGIFIDKIRQLQDLGGIQIFLSSSAHRVEKSGNNRRKMGSTVTVQKIRCTTSPSRIVP